MVVSYFTKPRCDNRKQVHCIVLPYPFRMRVFCWCVDWIGWWWLINSVVTDWWFYFHLLNVDEDCCCCTVVLVVVVVVVVVDDNPFCPPLIHFEGRMTFLGPLTINITTTSSLLMAMMLLPLLFFFIILILCRGVPFIYPSWVNQSVGKSPAFCSWSLGGFFFFFVFFPFHTPIFFSFFHSFIIPSWPISQQRRDGGEREEGRCCCSVLSFVLSLSLSVSLCCSPLFSFQLWPSPTGQADM